MRRRVCLNLMSFFALAAIVLLVPPSAEGPVCAATMRDGPQRPAIDSPQLTTGAAKARLIASYGKLPLSFEPNQGQSGKQARFLSRGSGYALFLTGDEAVLALRNGTKESRAAGRITSPKPGKSNVLRMKLVGANPSTQVIGLDKLPGKSNYFIGKDPLQWRTNVPNFAKVRYQNVYPGIDLVYYGNQRQLEYDFVVAPGADPKAIALEIAGASGAARTTIGRNGDLIIKTKGGEVRFHKPVVYQVENSSSSSSSRKSIDGRFVLLAKNQIGFEIPSYDPAQPLYIDPVISYATYLGGSSGDSASAIAVDASGNVYLTGETESSDFPVTGGALDTVGSSSSNAFVTKMTGDFSSLVYSTFLGGSGEEGGYHIAVDAGGNAYLSGTTNSSDFPTANGYQIHPGGGVDDFVSKLNSTGSALLYSTYLGGSRYEDLPGMALDSAGNVYVAGTTDSDNFPTVNPIQATFHGGTCGYGDSSFCYDAFVAKINPSAIGAPSLVYSTYLGGSSWDVAISIAVDADGNAYVAGDTGSSDFPASPATYGTQSTAAAGDFVTKINAAGTAFVYSTFIGGGWGGWGAFSIAVDASGSAYVTGLASQGLPVTPGAYDSTCGAAGECNEPDAFVTKLDPGGSQIVYCTYLGGSGWDWPSSITVDAMGTAYVTGFTNSLDFPLANAIYPSCTLTSGYCGDGFLTKLSADGTALIFSTFLGGGGGSGVAVDSSRDAFIAGGTTSPEFPVTPGAYKTTLTGDSDAFAMKLSNLALALLAKSAESLNFGNQSIGTTSPAQTVTIRNAGDAPTATLSFNIAGDFQLSQTCAAAIAPGGDCTMDVTFTPQAAGTRTGAIKKYNSITGQWDTFVSLTGIGVSPSLDVSSSNLAFADQLVGTTSKAQTVTLTNTGNTAVNFSSIEAATNFTHSTTCGDSLAAGASCTINITFAPKATGLMTEQCTIAHDAPGSPHTIALSGKGTDFSVLPASGTSPTTTVAAGEKATYGLSLNPIGFSGNVAMACKWPNGQPRGTSCSVSPSAVSLDGTNAANVIVKVTTTARSALPAAWKPQPPAPTSYPVSHLAVWVLALAVLASISLRRRRATVILASVLFATVLWTACGGGSASVAPTPVSSTPAGTYTLSVTGTVSSVTRSTDLTLVVK